MATNTSRRNSLKVDRMKSRLCLHQTMRSALVVTFLVLLMASAPLSVVKELDYSVEKKSESTPDVHDVPNWRIGDKWVYETEFDVAQLIQQANVSASLSTLTGDTTMEVVDIKFEVIENIQTLVYELDIQGDFTSGNNGASFQGVSGRLDIEYEGTDIIRVSDLAVWESDFFLGVDFAPFNIGILSQDIADIDFETIYNPPREKYDFPLRTGDQWTSRYKSAVNVSGDSDFFNATEFNTPYIQDSTTYQVTKDGSPIENGDTIAYSGCSDSHKVEYWNNTGTPSGFEWYCDAVRSYAWLRVSNAIGFQIDWKLKTYTPAQSTGFSASSSPGFRNVVIDVTPEFVATLPNATEAVYGHMTTSAGPIVSRNLQLRYEAQSTILSLTTNSSGKVAPDINVGNTRDNSNSSDDWTSHGVIIWDPVSKVIGAATIVLDLTVVGIDLVAKSDSIIVKRTRDNNTVQLSKATGYNALPGDSLHFSVPAQNRGVLTSPATVLQITTPDGNTIRGNLSALSPYSEGRVDVNWTVPTDAPIGNQTLSFFVDPDANVTEDMNRTNNEASLDIFVGRLPSAQVDVFDDVYTFENVTIDASTSFDNDGGEVECFFEIQDGLRTQYIDAPNCQTTWSWDDDGDWDILVRVVDDELDEDIIVVNATVLNRDPYVNLTANRLSVEAGSTITFDASDSGDIDTISPIGQDVEITWPGSFCNEGIFGPSCTITADQEGQFQMEVVVTDDDGAAVSDFLDYEVLNVAPTLGEIQFAVDGIPIQKDLDGTWTIDEDIVAVLSIEGYDTLSDIDDILITWYPDSDDMNWTETTYGSNSEISVSWPTSGLHTIRVFATDNDGITSEEVLGYVRVNNIAPDLGVLPAQQSLFEDEILYLNSTAIDFADSEDLRFCWDLLAGVDSDNNGVMIDDCDITGNQLVYSWTTSGIKTITAIVWDDDNASDYHSIDVNIVNRPPIASITVVGGMLDITEGESLTFSGAESSDTSTDRGKLVYIWDDPKTTGATQDGFGINYTMTFDTPGTFAVNLTVTDDDGKSSTATVQVVVKAKPVEGLFGMENSTILGYGMGATIILLLVVLLLRGRESNRGYDKSGSMIWDNPIQSQVQSPILPPEQTSFANIPPLPATGLPPGWTMEQWQQYGAQYVQQNPPPMQAMQQPAYQQPVHQQVAQPVQPMAYQQQPMQQPQYSQPVQQPQFSQPVNVQPVVNQQPTELSLDSLPRTMVQEPPPTPASQALADLLDDLDL